MIFLVAENKKWQLEDFLQANIKLKITPTVVFVIMIQPIFPSWALAPTLCMTEDSLIFIP